MLTGHVPDPSNRALPVRCRHAMQIRDFPIPTPTQRVNVPSIVSCRAEPTGLVDLIKSPIDPQINYKARINQEKKIWVTVLVSE